MIVNFNGGLGNQLFQFALSIYLSKTFEQKVEYDLSDFIYKSIHQGFVLNKIIRYPLIKQCSPDDLKKVSPLLCSKYGRIFLRKFYSSSKILIDSNLRSLPNTPLLYYWGDWHNLNLDYPNLIRPYLLSTDRIPIENSPSNSVFIHVRRGDYVNNPNHHLCSIQYYEHAINFLCNKLITPKFRVYSDDIYWCKQHLVDLLHNKDFFFSESSNALHDFNEMRLCEHAIISNSTFSWWAAQLINILPAGNTIIYPRHWSNNSKYQIQIPKHWIPLPHE